MPITTTSKGLCRFYVIFNEKKRQSPAPTVVRGIIALKQQLLLRGGGSGELSLSVDVSEDLD